MRPLRFPPASRNRGRRTPDRRRSSRHRSRPPPSGRDCEARMFARRQPAHGAPPAPAGFVVPSRRTRLPEVRLERYTVHDRDARAIAQDRQAPWYGLPFTTTGGSAVSRDDVELRRRGRVATRGTHDRQPGPGDRDPPDLSRAIRARYEPAGSVTMSAPVPPTVAGGGADRETNANVRLTARRRGTGRCGRWHRCGRSGGRGAAAESEPGDRSGHDDGAGPACRASPGPPNVNSGSCQT